MEVLRPGRTRTYCLIESKRYNFCDSIFLAELILFRHLADMRDAEKRDEYCALSICKARGNKLINS